METITRDGFGDPYNHGLRAFATNEEEGWMVIGTANPFMGTQLWRTVVDTDASEDTSDSSSSDLDTLFNSSIFENAIKMIKDLLSGWFKK